MEGPATGAGGAGPAAPPPTFFQQVGDVRLVPVPHPDLPLVCQEGLLLGVVDQRVEEEVLESSTGRGRQRTAPRLRGLGAQARRLRAAPQTASSPSAASLKI